MFLDSSLKSMTASLNEVASMGYDKNDINVSSFQGFYFCLSCFLFDISKFRRYVLKLKNHFVYIRNS